MCSSCGRVNGGRLYGTEGCLRSGSWGGEGGARDTALDLTNPLVLPTTHTIANNRVLQYLRRNLPYRASSAKVWVGPFQNLMISTRWGRAGEATTVVTLASNRGSLRRSLYPDWSERER
ncbi:hypothetical protein J6590_098181 [Homalodisca vitripennis]|nr:hypothetical protein J6590_098181 [Homalodisca vitripennis]